MIHQILNKYINNERGTEFALYSPDNVAQLLTVLGNPQIKLKTVHVAGTNGKGTTCFILAGVLENSGYRTGLFISPHLEKINERIRINSSEISDDDLLQYIAKTDKAATEYKITVTYFDILTSAAFCYFYDQSVDIAIIETGLGGRLDSTNSITPEVSIITDISMDHAHILGDTIEKITSEKCGIIKPGIPVITSNTDQKIVSIIRKSANEKHSNLIEMNKTYNYEVLPADQSLFKFRLNFDTHNSFIIEISLFPEHQIKNAATSAVALLLLRENGFNAITTDIIIKTLKKIIIPGRFQKLSCKRKAYFDPAHNINSLSLLLQGFTTLFREFKILIILTIMKDKVTSEVLYLLQKEKENIIYYIIDDPRAYIPEINQFYLITDDRNIIIQELKSDINKNAVILFTGTFRIYDFAMKIAASLNSD
jgi:dihydrofolate synthase/folylpolyglutamate synthase